MPLTIKNFTSELSPSLIKQAEKNTVRECDEEEPGKFVAFVDEKEMSYDVSLEIKNGNEIIAHQCDCNSKKEICSHKVALLQYISGKKKKAAVKKIPKKDQRLYDLLDEADLEKLKLWIRQLVEKNKDLRLSLEAFISGQKTDYTADEVKKITDEAIKTVIGRKSTADATQMKKIVELWETLHQPVIEYFTENMLSQQGFAAFNSLVRSCYEFKGWINGRTDRITKYLEKIIHSIAERVSGIMDDETWKKISGYFESAIHLSDYSINIYYTRLFDTIYQVSSESRKRQLTEMLVSRLTHKTLKVREGAVYGMFLLNCLEENNMFETYHPSFLPLRFQNAYNLKLIDLLIKHGKMDKAELYCRQQVDQNIHNEFSFPYWSRLQHIYRQSNDMLKLIGLTKELLPYSFNFEDYLEVMKNINEEEGQKLRKTMMAKARNSRSVAFEAEEFYFKLLAHEGKYKKMIEVINGETNTEMIVKYFEPMTIAGKEEFLYALVQRHHNYFFHIRYDYTDLDFEFLPGIIPKYYPAETLRLFLKRYREHEFKTNLFLAMLRDLANRAG